MPCAWRCSDEMCRGRERCVASPVSPAQRGDRDRKRHNPTRLARPLDAIYVWPRSSFAAYACIYTITHMIFNRLQIAGLSLLYKPH